MSARNNDLHRRSSRWVCQALGFVEGVSSGCGGCLLGGVGSGLFRRGWGVSVLVFFGGVHVDRGMRADGVVPVDPLGRRDLQVVDGVPGAPCFGPVRLYTTS